MKISEIEQKNVEAWKSYFNEKGEEINNIQLKRLNNDKGLLFRITQEQFQDFLTKHFEEYLKFNKITNRQFVEKTLENLKEYIELNKVQILIEQSNQRMQIENSEDEDFQDELDNFEVRKWLKIKAEVPQQKKYKKNEFLNLVNSFPQDYPKLSLSFNRDGEQQANLRRYQNFQQKFKKYLNNIQNFYAEINEIPSQAVVIICRLIRGEPQNDDQASYFLEYRVQDGFDYVVPEFSTLDNYLLYPGQMLLVEGAFFMGKFQISMIINTDNFSNQYLNKNIQTPLSKQCKIMFIKGPFYLKNFVFEDFFGSLKSLLKEYFCNLFVIQGPIISLKRKSKAEEQTYKQIKEEFLAKLKTHLDDQQVVYIEDEMEISLLNNIPIPAMEQDKFDKKLKNIITMPSPCVLQIGNVNIAICANKLYDDFMHASLHKSSIEESKQKSVLRSIMESHNLHPIFVPGDQTQYSLINEMSYDFPIDIYLLSTSKEESFAENIDDNIK